MNNILFAARRQEYSPKDAVRQYVDKLSLVLDITLSVRDDPLYDMTRLYVYCSPGIERDVCALLSSELHGIASVRLVPRACRYAIRLIVPVSWSRVRYDYCTIEF